MAEEDEWPSNPGTSSDSSDTGISQSADASAEMPGYVELFSLALGTWRRAWRDCAGCGYAGAWDALGESAFVSCSDAAILLGLALGWTLLRHAATEKVFGPMAQWLRLRPADADKFPESCWKLLFYLAIWLYAAHLLVKEEYPFYHNPAAVFYGWKRGIEVPTDIYLAYVAQASFYAHSIYGTLYMDAWRKDSPVMLLHHVITLSLLISSYAFRYHNVGMLALFLHDVTDIQLEFTKLNVYLKTRNNTYHRLNNILSNIGCITFAVSWFVFRLYWFPLKVLYATCVSSMQTVPDIPFYFFFNCLLFTIALMNLYWFSLILMFVMKVVTGRITEVDDVREYDIELKKAEMRPAGGDASNKNHYVKGKVAQMNGLVKDKRQ